MRSLLFAQRLKGFKIQSSFISLDKKEFKQGHKLIKKAGFKLRLIKNLNELSNHQGVMILDDCLIKSEDLNELKRHFKKLIIIDDENELENYNVDALINPNPYAKHFPYKSPKTTKFFFDISFLRDEFLGKKHIRIKKDIRHIFLTLGGSDDTNLSQKIIKELKGFLKKEKITLHIAIGKAFKHKKALLKLKSKELIFYKKAKMASLMQKSDVGICGCGQSVYEFFSLGVPLVALVLAPNQQNLAKFAQKNAMLVYAKTYKDIKNKLLAMSVEKRMALQENIKKNFHPQNDLKDFTQWLRM